MLFADASCPERSPLGQASSQRDAGSCRYDPKRQPLGQDSSLAKRPIELRGIAVPNVSRSGRIHHGKYLWGDLRIPNVSRSDRIHHA
jgi:hypothetical protein